MADRAPPDVVWILNDVDEEEEAVAVDDGAAEKLRPEAPAERSGHVAVMDGVLMYVWGGYKKSAQNRGFFDLYLPRYEMWVYDTEAGLWSKHSCSGNLHKSMSGSCGACVHGVLYLFGGHHDHGNTNRIYRLPLRASSLVWEEMSLRGVPPSSKDKLGCWSSNNRLVFFGGYGLAPEASHRGTFEFDESSLPWDAGRGWNNHVHILDLETNTWSQPVTTGKPPSPRAAHACATLGRRGYVFGGRYKNFRLNDMYYLDLDTWEWHEVVVPQHGPVGRSWHSFTPVSHDQIFLFGGFTTDEQTLSDAWIYSISKNEWKTFKHEHTDSPRLWHSAGAGPDGEVFVFGGCANNLISRQRAAHSNKLLVFDVQPKTLFRLSMETVLQHQRRLVQIWDCLPKHLLNSLRRRIKATG